MSSSGDFILKWLNESLNIQPPITNIPNDFSNGYKFALLLKINNEITQDELNEFKDSNNIQEIKSNFKKLKIILHDKLYLDIREDEFNDVINKDISQSVVILYKIKNSYHKKKINFLEIKTSDTKLTKEELNQKINELLGDTTKDNKNDKSNKDKEKEIKEATPRKEVYNKYTIRKMFDGKSDLNPIESVSSGLNTKMKNINPINKIKKSQILNKDNFDDLNINTNYSKNTNNSNAQTFGSDTEKNKYGYNNSKTVENNIIKRNKKLLPKIKIKKNIKFNFNFFSNTVGEEIENGFYNDFGMMKINEMNKKLKMDEMKQKEGEKEALIKKNKSIFETNEKYRLDFVRKVNNPLYKNSKSTGMKLSSKINNKYDSYRKRMEFAKEFSEINKREELNQQIFNIKKLINKDLDEIKKSQKIILRPIPNYYSAKNSLTKFNKINYLSQVDKINIKEYLLEKNKKYSNTKKIYPDIRDVMTSIIDLTEDIYEYQQENEKDTLELEDFQRFYELFIKKKQKKKVIQIVKSESIDNINSIKNLDPATIKLDEKEKYLIQDYINYIGIWNNKKIININESIKFDIRKVKTELPQDYEPTKNELDDITIPNKLNDNYLLGNIILHLIENKYNNINNEISETNKEENNDTKINMNKWDYIPYKISLIGLPLSGKKFIAENLIKKYPNMKIYSIKKIFREYYIQYKDITEKIDGNPKYVNLKPNQIEQLKEEKQKKLEEFEPIANILKPFIELINKEGLNKIEKNKSPSKSPRKSKRPSISKDKKSALNSPKKNRKSISQNEAIVVEENINEHLKKIPSDEILFNLLKYTIEKDFVKKSKEENENEINEYQKKVYDINKEIENYEKSKAENAKQNPKNDTLINNLNQNLENLKSTSIKGFILVDYPTNINQCVLLENYLTGYEDELQKPKTEKNIMLNNISNFYDYKIQPKENSNITKAGIDFIINLKVNEKEVDQRFQNIKYDPITDTIYTDLNDENNNKQGLDKKVMERLVTEVPYLNKEIMQFYKEEYKSNISSIKTLYTKFGMYIDTKEIVLEEELNTNINFNDKEIKKCFQQIDFDTYVENNHINQDINDNINEGDKNSSRQTKLNSPKKGENNTQKKTEKTEIKQELSKTHFYEQNLNKALNFISEEIINSLYKEKDKSDKLIFYAKNPELNNNNPEERIKIDPEVKNLEDKKRKVSLTQINKFSGESIFFSFMQNNIDYILKNISEFNIKYNNNIGKFVYLINIQKNKIYQKLNSYQSSFVDYLNYKTKKRKLIRVFIKRYNEFFEKNDFFQSDKAINEFNLDIEEISNDLWILINEKEKNLIKELNNIKNEGFMQKELEKFHFNIKAMFLNETEKFIELINSIVYLYSHTNKTDIKNHEDIYSLIETKINKNDIFKDILSIKIDDFDINDLIEKIFFNINIMFENSIKIIFSYEEIISKLLEEIKYFVMISSKKIVKKSTKLLTSTNNNMSSSIGGIGPISPTEKLLKILQNEKDKYKYRILYLKYFSIKYITIINQTFQNIYNNLDQWIVTNISLQNDALNSVVSVFKNKLKEHQLIDEKRDIAVIELDEFEKKEDEEENSEGKADVIDLKPIDNSSMSQGRVYNKLNIDYLIKDNFVDINVEGIDGNNRNKIYKMSSPDEIDNYKLKESDFFFDINKFNEIFIKVKKYEIEPNIISKDLFYEIFIKQYCIDKYEENINNYSKNNDEKNDNIVRTLKKKKTKTIKEEIVQKNEETIEENNTTENLTTKNNLDLNNINGICNALKMLNTHQQSRIYSLYKIYIDNKNKDNKEENVNNEISNEEKKEYEIYLNTNEIFTILALIGCKILNSIEEENIFKDLKDKLLSGKYLTRKDFIEYNFWFEKDLEYQKNINKQDETINKKSRKNTKDINNKINIKEFLFNLWKDDNGNMEFEKFMNILKINRYMTDINAFKEENYYNIIFNK